MAWLLDSIVNEIAKYTLYLLLPCRLKLEVLLNAISLAFCSIQVCGTVEQIRLIQTMMQLSMGHRVSSDTQLLVPADAAAGQAAVAASASM